LRYSLIHVCGRYCRQSAIELLLPIWAVRFSRHACELDDVWLPTAPLSSVSNRPFVFSPKIVNCIAKDAQLISKSANFPGQFYDGLCEIGGVGGR
jgi:hypothetical protein